MYEVKQKTYTKVGLFNGLLSFAQQIIGLGIFIIALGIGAYFVIKDGLAVGSLIMMVQLVNYIIAPVSKIQPWAYQIQEAKASAKRIGEILEIAEENNKLNRGKKKNICKIKVNELCFRYPESERDTLHDVSFEANKNDIVCIVGESGSGKSTLLKLLLGLYQPTSGKIEYEAEDGINNDINLISSCAYIPSNNFLFTGTLRENICMSENVDEKKLCKVAESANILQYIDTQEEKFDYFVNESGTNLSSGQVQRIAIARALYKQASVLVFDEPTANLDALSVEQFNKMIKKISKDKICIIVTHNLKTAEIGNQVYHIKDNTLYK